MGELSTALAHEMKQPLAAIMANVSVGQRLLQTDGAATAELRTILEDIAADDRRARDVIDHVRDLVRKEGAKAQVLSVNAVVSEVLALVRSDLNRRGVVGQYPAVRARPGGVRRPRPSCSRWSEPGHQRLRCDVHTPARPASAGRSTTAQGDARIEIRDRGSGIPPDALTKVFEPFVTTKQDGLGLGLAICRSIVTAHGGHISAANNPEHGTTFTVSLPLTGTTTEAKGMPKAKALLDR